MRFDRSDLVFQMIGFEVSRAAHLVGIKSIALRDCHIGQSLVFVLCDNSLQLSGNYSVTLTAYCDSSDPSDSVGSSASTTTQFGFFHRDASEAVCLPLLCSPALRLHRGEGWHQREPRLCIDPQIDQRAGHGLVSRY